MGSIGPILPYADVEKTVFRALLGLRERKEGVLLLGCAPHTQHGTRSSRNSSKSTPSPTRRRSASSLRSFSLKDRKKGVLPHPPSIHTPAASRSSPSSRRRRIATERERGERGRCEAGRKSGSREEEKRERKENTLGGEEKVLLRCSFPGISYS